MCTLGVGDVLLAQPLLAALRASGRFQRIVVLARHGPPAALMQRLGVADHVREYTSGAKHRLLGAVSIGSWIAAQRFKAVLTTTGMNPYYTGVMALLSGAPTRIGEHRERMEWAWTVTVPTSNCRHVVERNRALGEALGIHAGLVPKLIPTGEEQRRARAVLPHLNNLFAIAPGSNRELTHKRWAVRKFSKLSSMLIHRGCHPVILGGPDEADLGRAITADLPKDAVTDLVGRTDIGLALGVLAYCSHAMGNDGMLLHLAAAVGTPTIALFGPSDPALYRPMGSGHVVVTSGQNCAPCYAITPRGCHKAECMANLSVQDVMVAVENVMDRVVEQPKGLS